MLINKDINEVKKDKVKLAKEFADKYNIYLILKSAETIIAVPNDKVYILNTGNTALSKGGSGDALCGLAASLFAQGYMYFSSIYIRKKCRKSGRKKSPSIFMYYSDY